MSILNKKIIKNDNKEKEIVIRADASSKIGFGHIMRCLTLADEIKQKNARISFVSREEDGNLITLINERGYKVYPLSKGFECGNDVILTKEVLASYNILPDLLIVDHYGIDIVWESTIRSVAKKIMVIDDFCNRRHNCDLFLNQNYNVENESYYGLLQDNCIKLLGAKYSMLRPEFRKMRENLQKHNDIVKRILVLMGGADNQDMTSKVLQAIKMLEINNITVDVVVGAANKYYKKIKSIVSNIHYATCHYDVENISELMSKADLSIGAAGSTTWERCCMGLPSIVIAIAENQINIAENLGNDGIVVNLGWYENVEQIDIRDEIENLLNNSSKRMMMSLKAREVVDGRGVERVAEKIFKVAL